MRVVSFLILTLGVGTFTVQSQPATNTTLSVGNGMAVLRWQGAIGVKYRLERSSAVGGAWQAIDAPTTTHAETNILNGPVAFYRVATWFNPYPADTREPGTPVSITVNAPSCDKATLAWAAVTDGGGGASGTSEYLIYRGGAFLKSVPHADGATIFSTDDSNLLATGTYGYQIAAMDRAGNISARSSVVNITIPSCACGYTVSPSLVSLVSSQGGTGSFNVSAASKCEWTATANATWIHTTSGGSGNGTVNYTVDANTSTSARSGTITVGGQAVNVSQPGSACSYTLNSASTNCGASPQSGSFGMMAAAGCSWSAATSQTWIHTTSTGSGNGTVNYTVDANATTSSRSGSITVNGQTFTVNQLGLGCSYTLNSASTNCGASSQGGSFGVTAATGCSWSAASSQTWIHTASSGSGNGMVNYTVDANGSTSARSGTITVNGQTFSVSQGGATTKDVVLPTAAFLAPSQDAVLGGLVSLQVRLTDNVGLARAEFYIQNLGQWILAGTSVASGILSTNSIVLDTTIVPNGPHTLLCMTIDAAGNTSYTMLGISVANVTSDPGVSLRLGEVARPTSTGEVMGSAVKADGQGNIILAGTFKGNVNFGSISRTASGGSDIFICKYGPSGNLLWLRTFGGLSDDSADAVAIDASGNILITGAFSGTTDFGGGPLTSAAGIYGSDAFVAKYSSAGTHLWSKRLGGRFGNNTGAGLAVDPAGNVILAGKFYGEANLGGGLLLSRAGSQDGFVVKLAGQTGAYIWAKDFGGTGSDYVMGVAVDSLGDLVVVGYGYGSLDFGGGLVPNLGSADMFIVKYAGVDGRHLWSRIAGGSGPDTVNGVAVDANQNILVTGNFYGTMRLGGVSLTAPLESAVFVAKYDGAGSLQWAQALGYETSGGTIGSRAVAVDPAGNIAITGNATGGVDFGSGEATYGGSTFYVAKYDPQGAYLWAKRSANNGRCGGYGIATDNDRNVISTGFISGNANVDGLQLSSPDAQIKSAFLLKISP